MVGLKVHGNSKTIIKKGNCLEGPGSKNVQKFVVVSALKLHIVNSQVIAT